MFFISFISGIMLIILLNSDYYKYVMFVQVSFDLAEYTADVDAVGVLRILDAIRTCNLENKCKFYQASTSELYGKVQEIPQKETTPFYPRSPYGKYFFRLCNKTDGVVYFDIIILKFIASNHRRNGLSVVVAERNSL